MHKPDLPRVWFSCALIMSFKSPSNHYQVVKPRLQYIPIYVDYTRLRDLLPFSPDGKVYDGQALLFGCTSSQSLSMQSNSKLLLCLPQCSLRIKPFKQFQDYRPIALLLASLHFLPNLSIPSRKSSLEPSQLSRPKLHPISQPSPRSHQRHCYPCAARHVGYHSHAYPRF